MSYKNFTIIFFVLCTVSLGSVAAFNFYIDPLWTFNHAHSNNDVQTVIDERQQKMNDIYFANDFDYDTLLIGSSRTTYINPHDFLGMNVYNFAVSDLSFKEYKDMINFAKEQKGSEFERIIIGVDFFKSSKHQSMDPSSIHDYRETVTEPFYRWKNLISLDILDYAKKNYRLSKNDQIIELRNYNRRNVAEAKRFQPEEIEAETTDKINKFRNEFYGESYEYSPEFKKALDELKQDNPNTEFIIFTTPISAPLFEALVEEGNLDDYDRWLADIISVFGGVYNFMTPNSVTSDLSNYFDGHHFYPNVGKMIAETISTGEFRGDFGEYKKETFTLLKDR